MASEISRVAHFTGDEQVPTDIYQENLNETTRIYRASSFYPGDEAAMPDMSLSVREASNFIAEGLKTANPRYMDPTDIYPGAELRFEGKDFEYKHAIMLAQAALSEAAWKDFALVEVDEQYAKGLKRGMYVSEAQILRRKPGPFNELVREKGYAGTTEVSLGFATSALRQTGITRARFLPAMKNRR
jgi:hypothetical protein